MFLGTHRPRLDDKVSFDRRIPAGSRTATSRFIDQYSRLNEERSPHFSPSLLLDFPTRDGIDPAVNATSAVDGSYAVTVPVGSKLFFLTSRTNYRRCRPAFRHT